MQSPHKQVTKSSGFRPSHLTAPLHLTASASCNQLNLLVCRTGTPGANTGLPDQTEGVANEKPDLPNLSRGSGRARADRARSAPRPRRGRAPVHRRAAAAPLQARAGPSDPYRLVPGRTAMDAYKNFVEFT